MENHVHAFVNIAGPMLGVPKAIPALLSGGLGDTAAMFPQPAISSRGTSGGGGDGTCG